MEEAKVYKPRVDDDIIDPETIEIVEEDKKEEETIVESDPINEEDDDVVLGIPKDNKPSYEYLRAQVVILLQKSLDSLISLLSNYQDKIPEDKIARITKNYEELMSDIKDI